MHDSFTPLGGMVPFFVGMMLQCVFGGKGVGFLAALVYGIIAVFVAGLMVGRTPEFLGKKIEKPEIILVSLTLLIHPLVILAPTGWSVVAPYGLASMGERRHARLFRDPLRLQHFGRQQRLGIRRAEWRYALVQLGDGFRHPDRPLSADHLHDGGCRLGRGQAYDSGDDAAPCGPTPDYLRCFGSASSLSSAR